ncbi:EAL domain-containing protein [Vibrio sp. WXL210]|uniref:EAL domain-containing protein n=1 Tax=Vibrio sp. WXL210 TaxID=3450709 RepID=UPI003EC6D5B7
MTQHKLGIQGKYIAGTVILIVTTVCLIAVLQLKNYGVIAKQILVQSKSQTQSSLLQQMEKKGLAILDYISVAVINPYYEYDLEATYRLLKPARKNEDVVSILVFDTKGKIFHDSYDTIPSYGIPLANPQLIETVISKKQLYSVLGDNHLVLAKPILMADRALGGVQLTLSLDNINQDIEAITGNLADTSKRGFHALSSSLIIIALIACLIGATIAVLIARSLVRPIYDLVAHTQRIGRGDYDTKLLVTREDEVGELTSAFSQMAHNLKAQTDEISFLAFHDSLTKLPNRPFFIKQLNQLLEGAEQTRRFSILFLDLDEFKFVNDNYGHEAGDRLLQEVSGRLTSNIRYSGDAMRSNRDDEHLDLVARIGGDEFVFFISEVKGQHHTDAIAKRLLAAIRQPIYIDEDEVAIGGSIGIARYPEDGRTADELICHADLAMYEAKRGGKNNITLFDPHLAQNHHRHSELEFDLRRATQELEQFEVHFQPQFSIKRNELVGAEAILYWNHPTQGLLPPREFIPIAEKTGLIIPIGHWAIKNACRQLRLWQSMYQHDLRLSLNLSAKQLHRPDTLNLLDDCLARQQVAPSSLHVEITEATLLKDELSAQKAIRHLSQLGIPVWIGNYGTGYSSLAYLQRFQVDGIKIDHSFMLEIESNPHDQALVAAMTDVAHHLRLAIAAKGIDSCEPLVFLRDTGCDLAQGDYYSDPIPAAQFQCRFLQRNNLLRIVPDNN